MATQRWGVFSCDDCGAPIMVADADVTEAQRTNSDDAEQQPCAASVWTRWGVEQCRGYLRFRGFLNLEL